MTHQKQADKAYPAESREVMMDCRELDNVYDPSAFCSPKRSMKSGIMRHPYGRYINEATSACTCENVQR